MHTGISSNIIPFQGNSGYPKETSKCAKGNKFINVRGSIVYKAKKLKATQITTKRKTDMLI